ncbi:MAG: Ig-like domain-containing protein [bacterium]|nr:Ig-like domain-containing protein [bacterium]
MLKRIFQLNLSAKEVVWSKRILAAVMLPVVVFYMSSINILLMGMMTAKAADGSGHMTINKDMVAAGGTQTYKLTFDPTESMDGGSVEITVPSSWTAPVDGNTSLTVISGATFGSLSFSGQKITVPITTMASNQGFYLTLTGFVAPVVTGDYTFTTKSKITADGSLRGISGDPTVTVTAGAADHYAISAISSPKTVGVNFDVTVTAKDVNNNTAVGSGTVAISVQTGTGALVGDTSADTTGDGADTVTLKYNKVENGVVLRASADSKTGDSNAFNVNNISAPSFSSPGSNISDSTPTINWSDVSGTGVEYTMKLKARAGGDCATEDYSSGLLLDENTAGTSQYQPTSAEALLDETTYCLKVTATDDYSNSVDAYKTFNLLTSKPATPSAVVIEAAGSIDTNGHPANTINIYNNESVDVKVTHASGLDQGKAYVEISDGLGNTVTGNTTISGSGTTSTTVTGIDASSLQQGSVTIKARVEDAATNSSNLTAGTAGTKDTNPPAKPSAVSFDDDPVNIANKTAVNISVTGESGTDAHYSATSSGGAGTVSDHFTMTDATTGSPNKNMTDLPDGTLTASVYLVDSAWNHSSNKTGSVTKDATAPNVALSYDLSRPVKDADTLRVTAAFNEAVKDAPIPQIAIDFAGGLGNDISATNMTKTDATHYFYDADVPAGNDGIATVTISSAQDLAGNGNNAATSNTFTVDNTNPTIVFTNNVEVGPVASDTIRITITETNADASSYKYVFSDDTNCSTKDYSGGIAYTSASDFVINDQTHNTKYICAKAVDQAGNFNYQASANPLNVDITGPTLSFSDNVAVGPVQSDTIIPSWGDAALMKWKYNSNTTCSANAEDYDKTNANSMDQSDQTNNTKYICMYAEDALGNKTTLASANPINIDVTAPIITITNPDGTPAQSKTITASATESATKYYAVNNAGNNTCDGNLVFTAYDSINFSAEGDNGKKVCYKAVDTAGNLSYSLSSAIAGIDTTAPTLQSFTSTTANGTYGPSSNINVTANYDENIAGGSTITVVLNNGANVTLNTVSGTTIYGTYSVGITGSGEDRTNLKVSSITVQNVSDAAGNNLATNGAYAGTNISDGINVDVSAPAASLSGTPANPTNITSLNVTVGGAGVVNYQYRLDSTDDYSAVTPIATHITASGLSAGPHTLNVKGIDAAENEQSSPTSYIWIIDTTAPATAISYSANPAKNGAMTITATYSEDIKSSETPKISIDQPGITDISNADMTVGADRQHWNYVYTVNAANGGTYVDGSAAVSLSTTHDEAGNTAGIPSSASFMIDTTAPAAPVITHIASDEKINKAEEGTIIVIGTAEAGATVNLSLSDTHGHTVSGSGTATGGNFSITIDGISLEDDTVTPSATATDVAGNTSGAAITPTAIKDTGAPIVSSVVLSDPSPTNAGLVTFTVNFNENMNTGVNSTVSFGLSSPYNQHTTVSPHWNSATQFTSQITIAAWDGTNTIKVSGAKDAAGNTMADDISNTFIIDTIDPIATISLPASESYKSSGFTISGTASDENSGLYAARLKIQRSSDGLYWRGSSWGASFWVDASGTTAWSYNFTASIQNVTYTIEAKAQDNAGNYPTSGFSTITIYGDTNEPTSAVTSPANGSYVNSIAALFGSAGDPNGTNKSGVQKVEIGIKDETTGKYWKSNNAWGDGESYLAASYSAGNWTKDSNLPAWESGTSYTVHSKSTDNAGNIQSGNGASTFLFDNTAPTVVLFDDHADSIVRDADTVVITATFTEADQIDEITAPRITINSPAPLVDNALMTKTSNLVWTYSWDVPAGSDGAHTVSISAQDRAGNASAAATGKTSYTIDNTNPTISISNPAEGQYKKGTFTITADAADAVGLAKVEFYDGLVKLGDDTDGSDGYSYSWATISANDGAHSLTAKAIDQAGNTLTSSAVNITVDNTNPTAAAIADPTVGQTKRGTITISVDAADAIGLAKIEFYKGADKIGEDAGSPYSISWDTASVVDGDYSLTAIAIDNAGNTLTSSTVGITVDNTIPSTPIFNSPQNADTWYSGNPSLDIDFSDNIKINTVEYKVDSGGTYRTIASNVNAAAYMDNWLITDGDWTAMSQGTHHLYFRVTDYAGNQYITPDDGSGFRFKKDVTAPTAPTYNTAEDQWFASNPTLDIDFSDNQSLKKVEYQVDGSAGSWTTLADNISGLSYPDNWNTDVSVWSGLGDGVHYLYFRVTDYAENQYVTPNDTDGFTFKKDTTAPSAITGMTTDPAENTWTTDNTIAFNWDDSTDIGGSGLSGYSYVVDHTADTTPDAAVESATSAYITGALADGNDWYFHVKAIDSKGNATAVVHKGPFKIDTIAPDIIHTAVITKNVGEDIEIDAALDDNDGSGIGEARLYWKINSGSWSDASMSDIGEDNHQKTLDARTNPDDTVKYYIRSSDNLGNYIYKYNGGEGENEMTARNNAYLIDIISTVDKFAISSDTSQTDGSPFAATITAKDNYNNDTAFAGTVVVTVDGSTNSGSTWQDLNEGSYTVKVNGATTRNVIFNDQTSKSIIVELHGTGEIAYLAIRIHAEKSNDADISGNSDNISIAGFSATAVAGAESSGGEGGTPAVEGEQIQGAEGRNLKTEETSAPSPWKQALPYEAAGAVVLLGSGIWWWIRKIGGGIGSGGIKGFMFASLKNAASKIRMFLW